MKRTTNPGPPQTLMQAHEELVRTRPPEGLITGVAVVLPAVGRVYEQIAKTDPGHTLEALYWAQRERAHAKGIETWIKVLSSG